jgi:hypothetical protein
MYPHPYFVRKILVFLSLQVWLRCKIVKTMKFPAKSSRKGSYAYFRPLRAASGWKTDGPKQKLPESLCDEVRKSSANIRDAAGALRAWVRGLLPVEKYAKMVLLHEQDGQRVKKAIKSVWGKNYKRLYKYLTLGAKTRTRRRWGTQSLLRWRGTWPASF